MKTGLHRLIEWVDKEISESNGLGGTIALDNCRSMAETLIDEENTKMKPLTDEDVEFMQSCNMYITTMNGFFEGKIKCVKIMTENSEGAILEPNDLLKLSDILFRYVKSAIQ